MTLQTGWSLGINNPSADAPYNFGTDALLAAISGITHRFSASTGNVTLDSGGATGQEIITFTNLITGGTALNRLQRTLAGAEGVLTPNTIDTGTACVLAADEGYQFVANGGSSIVLGPKSIAILFNATASASTQTLYSEFADASDQLTVQVDGSAGATTNVRCRLGNGSLLLPNYTFGTWGLVIGQFGSSTVTGWLNGVMGGSVATNNLGGSGTPSVGALPGGFAQQLTGSIAEILIGPSGHNWLTDAHPTFTGVGITKPVYKVISDAYKGSFPIALKPIALNFP